MSEKRTIDDASQEEWQAVKLTDYQMPSAATMLDQVKTSGVAAVAAGSVRARIEQRMAFASGCEMHLSQIKVRQRGARHFIRRQEFDAAQKELTVLIEAASALKQHLTQWWGDSDAERGPNT